MKYLPLVWTGLWRKRARTILTFLSIVVAFLLYGLLSGLDSGMAHLIGLSRLDRMFTDPRLGFQAPVPISYAEQIAAVPGVTVVAPRMGLFGYYQDPKNPVGVITTDERFFSARPEIEVTRQQIDTLIHTRTGTVIGQALADKYGWKVGDKIPIVSTTLQKDGNKTWTFDIVAIVDDRDHPGQSYWFVANYKYIDEGRATGAGNADRFLLRISDPARATQIGQAIDRLFANSPSPTRTQSDRVNSQSAMQYWGDTSVMTHAIVATVFAMLLLITANTMMQSMRERVPEFAVLKTLGFSDRRVLLIVLAESVLLCLLAGAAGMFLAKAAVPLVKNNIQFYAGAVQLPWPVLLSGLGVAAVVGAVSGLLPAWRAMRLNIVDALAAQ